MNDSAATSPDVSALNFEDALIELESIVRQLEAGQVPLDATIGLYDRATALKQLCETRLRDAEMRIERIVATPAGVETAPFDDQA